MASPVVHKVEDIMRIIDLKLNQEKQLFTQLFNNKIVLWKNFYINYFINCVEYKDIERVNNYLVENKLLSAPNNHSSSPVPVYIAWRTYTNDVNDTVILKLESCALIRKTMHYIIYISTMTPYYTEITYKSAITIIE